MVNGCVRGAEAGVVWPSNGYHELEPGEKGTTLAVATDGALFEKHESLSCYDRYKGLCAAAFLSLLTAALFVLRSGTLASDMCSNVILLYAEAIKFTVAIAYVLHSRQSHKLLESIPLAFVPVTLYVTINLLSFWALKYVDASLGALMSQIKLPATAVFSRLFLGRVVSFNRGMALSTIFLGSLSIAAYGEMQEAHAEAEAEAEGVLLSHVTMATYLLATLALLVESCLSAATGVYTQWIFNGSMDLLWVRNAQFALISMVQYAVLQWVVEDNTGQCEVAADVRGMTVAALFATMGISVALTLLWLGAIEKTVASVSSVILTMVADHLFVLHTVPSLLQIAIGSIILNGIIQFSLSA
ncbi:hypothetical protein AB1Y20_011546 [Prymnesium parvum]|uniref:Sugar phosphate transporter domain-containing protein n=1 Tax=Prymnesium parvum TaxID=97485 RepID=A0AB34IGQ9_PRYPA